ncbi:hypothetical protein RJ641_009865 [Dillenia turbinata]|uniref:Retrovirus-related Pol polyprotein from transposon TNT 1-94-like beta-barrel domain-containing protein n=1 Tax=Dillenia turbinata TaxID=194707 RepID=A0AAN8UX91_9MAGN
MEGEDLWEIVNKGNVDAPANVLENIDAFKRWKQLNAKAEFILKRSISHDLFYHIMRCKSAHEIWQTLDKLFNKKHEAWLQILENELVNTTQGNLLIAEYFLKIKNLCLEISLLNPKEAISEICVRRNIIQGLKSEYIPYITSIQGWVHQPSLKELDNLLSSQESLAKQMDGVSSKEGEGVALMVGKKNFKGKGNQSALNSKGGKEGPSNTTSKKVFKYEEDWGKCFIAETRGAVAMAAINFGSDWVVDSGCGHHLTGDQSKFSSFQEYNGCDAIVIADNTVHHVENEGTIVINK